jgi:PIN like domain
VTARFFVDENDLALGKALAQHNADVVFPGHRDLPEIVRGVADDEWLPTVGARRLVVITRDQRIRYRAVKKWMWSRIASGASCSPAGGASRPRTAWPS